MDKKLAHFILIRFSVPIVYGTPGITTNEEWLRSRWKMFSDITLPSLRQQSNQNFRTIVFFDKKSPDWLITENSRVSREFSGYTPFYVSSIDDAMEQSNRYFQILQEKEGFTHLMTTRIDSDDAFHKETTKILQDQFNGQDFAPINLYGIVCFSSGINETTTYYKYPRGPFETYIQKAKKPIKMALFTLEHGTIGKEFPVIQVGPFPYALQYIHGGNVENDIRGIATNIDLADYGIDYTIKRSYIKRLLESLRGILSRKVAKLKRSIKKRVRI